MTEVRTAIVGLGRMGRRHVEIAMSLGLEIVNILTHQLRGKFSWERETAGTTFRVSFPEQQSGAENRHSAASGT